ncbi:MAG TPA: proline iminopeptidase-family hydrolase, partial [Methanomassiliicoccales archaeon]|nr:proline iminopeptidase-family hydrolase [Methanomassiliicoccales archaeon]
MREGFIESEGHRLWYSVYGEKKRGTPLLVLHGGPGFMSLPQVVSDLADERPVYFYDQLGCGRSERAAAKSYYSLDNYVNELAAVQQELELDEVILMGFSWGTTLACSYMLSKRPKGVKGMVLSGPYLSTARWDADQRENIARLPKKVREAIEEGERNASYGERYRAAMMEYYRRHVCILDPWPDFVQEALSKMSMDVYGTMWGASEFTITGTLKNLDLVPKLRKIEVPVLLTCGDRDEAGVKTVKD